MEPQVKTPSQQVHEKKVANSLSKRKKVLLTGIGVIVLGFLINTLLQTTMHKPQSVTPTYSPTKTPEMSYCLDKTVEHTVRDALRIPEKICVLRLVPEDKVVMLASLSGSLKHVETIYFNKNNPANIPPEIGNLQTLTALNFHHTVNTVLPPEIGKLNHLTVLHLSKTDITKLPPEIGSLTHLRQLIIMLNEKPVFLPATIAQLQSLRVLTLRSNPARFWVPGQYIHQRWLS